ncbi:Corticotropin-releasing factor receptor 2 [Varanus komodoensis]|nr:Corticotropin-releasing factor receptor 2 [Varanus komodoensis]
MEYRAERLFEEDIDKFKTLPVYFIFTTALQGNAYRECMGNGTWAFKVNYSQCEPILVEETKPALHYKVAMIINYLGHCLSVGALVVAFLLFLCLRSIRCLRNIIHWNLITTFILRNVMWFVLQMIDHNIHESNEVMVRYTHDTDAQHSLHTNESHYGAVLWCRCITTIFNYFVVTNFFWMFVEGCYLHTAIVMTYSTDKLRKWVFLFIGWCIPCPIIVAWAVCKLQYEDEQCWFGKEPGKYIDYIYQGPVILVLLVRQRSAFKVSQLWLHLNVSPDEHHPWHGVSHAVEVLVLLFCRHWYINNLLLFFRFGFGDLSTVL